MKRKHKDAMIAMGIKISALEQIQRNHGQAHMAQDLLPQFTELVKKVEKLEGQLNFKLNDGPIANHSKRIADLEETAEALSETVDQSTLSSKMFLERVVEIEILKTKVSGLEMRLSRAQDMIAECHPSGYITVKKAGRAVGKAADKSVKAQ